MIGAHRRGHNILELFNVSVQVRFATSKTNLVSSMTNLVTYLPNELPNDVTLRTLGN